MFKILILATISIFSLKANVNVFAKCDYNNVACKKILTGLCIDPTIKSVRGWRRVCNNNKLVLYTCNGNFVKDKVILEEACSCLRSDSKTAIINPFYIEEIK